MIGNHNSALDSGGTRFTPQSLCTKTIKELTEFAIQKGIKIPTEYKHIDEIREFLKLEIKFSEIESRFVRGGS